MPNIFAHLVVFSFPLVALLLFRRHPLPAAIAWTLALGLLLLPSRVSLDLPMLPRIDKDSLPALSAMLLSTLTVAKYRQLQKQGRDTPTDFADAGSWIPKSKLLRGLCLLFLVSPMLTVLNNSDSFFIGGRFLQGLRPYDALSIGLTSLMTLLPFLLARRFFGNTRSQVTLLKVLCIAMMCYAVLALVEVRLSPQINRWVYGFFPHSFVQHIRGGGFRPLVFLNHGLILGILFSMAALGALGLRRSFGASTPGYIFFAIPWLILSLVLSKTLGALAITILIIPIMLFLSVRAQMLFAAMIALVVLIYPMLRGADLVPVSRATEVASRINPTRAASLDFRFTNEDVLLERANQRPVLGWGGWGRSRIYDESTGRDISVTDGAWVIIVGTGGWLGYIAWFGILAGPLVLLGWRRKEFDVSITTSVLCLVHAANLIDLIPNSGLTPISWMVTGALWGKYELGKETPKDIHEEAVEATSRSPYRRHLKPLHKRPGGQLVASRPGRGPLAPKGFIPGRDT